MKRSQINRYIRDAEHHFATACIHLPEWAHWKPEHWLQERTYAPERFAELFAAGLGWDLTDFGQGDFEHTGLLLFTVRNGAIPPRIPYAEKIMVVGDRQITPMHFHWQKTEDIINRGGGTLVIKLFMADPTTEQTTNESFVVYRDGIRLECQAGTTVRLAPGQSITLYPYLYHSFWAEGGPCTVGEVSSVNDDTRDNRFLEPVGRFPTIKEDEEPFRLLCTEYDSEQS